MLDNDVFERYFRLFAAGAALSIVKPSAQSNAFYLDICAGCVGGYGYRIYLALTVCAPVIA